MATIWLSPDCEQGKHDACTGEAWDKEADGPTLCGCCERNHKVADVPEPKHGDVSTCESCGGTIEFYEHSQSTGLGTYEVLDSWWSHDQHPADGHDAKPIR